MIIWIDAQFSPAIAKWIEEGFQVEAHALRDVGLHNAKDLAIFNAARQAKAVVMTKDADFIPLLDQHGSPPKILWITCGNTSNAHLKKILMATLSQAIEMLNNGESLVEISDSYAPRSLLRPK